MQRFSNFINGELVEPFSKEYFENINPANAGDVVGLFPRSDERDIETATQAASASFYAWKDMTSPRRGDIIFKVAELMRRDMESLAAVIVREMGKTLPEARGDIQSSIDAANFMAGEGRRMYGQTTYSVLQKRWALTKRSPIGVCGLITAWNAPMAIIAWKLFPALICGNTVVLKPSEYVPLTAHLLGQLLKEAGVPNGVVNIVYGTGPKIGEALVQHPAVKLISFTGSSRVGRLIAQECGRRLKRCSLELGGKNGLIVMSDADLDAAAKAVAAGAFSTAGQRCASTSRVFVCNDVYEDFLAILKRVASEMKVGAGTDENTKVCPVINKRQYENIVSYMEEAKKEGATLIYGGRLLQGGAFAGGYFLEPTIFGNMDIHAKLSQEEVFGPILSVFRIRDLRDGITLLNDTNYGLTASIFTSNINLAIQAVEEMEAGCCYVNAPTFGSEPHMPFGGVKDSGNGTREPGTQSLDVFSEWKTIYIDYSGVVQNSQYRIR